MRRLNLALATAGAATAASTSLGTGMYGAAYMNTTGMKSTTSTAQETSVGFSFTSGNSMNIASNENLNMVGSLLGGNNVDVSAKDVNIKAGESNFTQDQSQKSVNAGVSYGNNAVQVSAGYSQNQNAIIQTTHQNSQILANNLNLTTTGDTNIIGGNIEANTAMINIGGNLKMETLQDTYEETGSGFGVSIGGSSASGGSSSNSPKTGGFKTLDLMLLTKTYSKLLLEKRLE